MRQFAAPVFTKSSRLFHKNIFSAHIVAINNVALIAYVDADNNLLNCVAMDAAEPGFYLFAFSPADDGDFQALASVIASSIRNY